MINSSIEQFFSGKIFPRKAIAHIEIENNIITKNTEPQDIINKEVSSIIRAICSDGETRNPIEDEVDFSNEKMFQDFFYKKSSFSLQKLDVNTDVATVKTSLSIYYGNIARIDKATRNKIVSLEVQAFYGRFKLI